ncbi:phosphate ABC transporter substrate-binding protein PstS family protein [Haloarcula salinisoli]|uniref:Phosphate ABC transporter substrate-binding protein PstS family protein n=1 Tax=Haloarcula salinisoli TaxID=2487746 RepID=A0A8J7YGK8_9EURY|nr:phosphate ABC transporter substrate-binding protein PstS family protein [Halomicroarcula salinisoli]MBX0287323.1 phosphate ABC transporter substrate-binding protein PstS family protein [Halomicroarcula salinisoli]MBX0305102.1 phosphate ABC transporter substrate-binding protein PstS family protein [Halomicroarcula salinisoli]
MSDSPNRSVSRRSFLTSAGAAGALALAGCTEGPGSGTETGLSGSIRISGSSTVYPVAQAVTEQFRSQNPNVEFNLSRDGSGGGFSNLFCEGNSDFNNASREISSDEEDQCSSNGVEYHQITVATDALTVIVNNDNDFATDLTTDQLKDIWQADGATTWQDVNGDWPDQEINRFGAADTSGTFDYFRETIIGEDANHTSNYEPTEQDNTILQGVQQDQYAIGYFGFSYYQSNRDAVTAVNIQADDSDSYVEPTLDNAKSGDYPLARPLFTYPKVSSLKEDHIAEFARFMVRQSANTELIADQIGYVPNTEEAKQSELDALNEVISNA